jgi:hypothetical protein
MLYPMTVEAFSFFLSLMLKLKAGLIHSFFHFFQWISGPFVVASSAVPQRMGYDQVTSQRAPLRDDSQLKAEEMPDLNHEDQCAPTEQLHLPIFFFHFLRLESVSVSSIFLSRSDVELEAIEILSFFYYLMLEQWNVRLLRFVSSFIICC